VLLLKVQLVKAESGEVLSVIYTAPPYDQQMSTFSCEPLQQQKGKPCLGPCGIAAK
jgi:hypothetical protein